VAVTADLVGVNAEQLPLKSDSDVVRARHRVRERAVALGFDLVAQTKVITAASELARNALIHGGGGELDVADVRRRRDDASGLRLIFTDTGPGIADIELALTSGWTSGTGLGLGLPGSRRLVDEFAIESKPDAGTRVTVVMWRRVRGG
jgi:serine/threonine-protein kinase RsbT